jgi:hypothetical protein
MSLLAPSGRKWPTSLKLTTAVTFLLLAVLTMINQLLISDEAPRGIISFELAATPEQASAMIRSWQDPGVVWAKASLYLDFAFIAAYLSFLLKLTRQWMIDRPGVREQQVGRWAKILFCTTAATDVGENLSLLVTLEYPQSTFWPMAAAILALVKFSSLLAGLGALIILRAARGHPLTT